MNKKALLYSFELLVVCTLFAICIFLLSAIMYRSSSVKSIATNLAENISADVVIDAGHGGVDGGAVALNGILEKDLNLELSLTLSEILSFCGVNNVLTRKSDSLVCDESDPKLKGKLKMTDLKNRLTLAEENEKAIFVSIHMNKFPISKYKGLQVYYSKNNEMSFELATLIENKTRELLQHDNNRASKAAGKNIFILDRISIPGVLIECGFLSNEEDTVLLSSEEYRTKLALVISESIYNLKNN